MALGTTGGWLGSPWAAVGLGVAAAYLLLALTVIPPLRHSRWRYAVREDQIDIRHGTFTIRRTVVPMRRVQHVTTTRGMIEQALELATVVFHTAAGANEIPALNENEADRVRTRIAALAGTADEL